MNFFVTSDVHLEDGDIIKHCRRPWCIRNPAYDRMIPYDFTRNNPLAVTPEALEAHSQAIIDKWNGMVGKKDKIIIVGDFCFANHSRYASALNGKKIIVLGNHDELPPDALKYFREIHEWGFKMSVRTNKLFPSGRNMREDVSFCHYAMRSWPNSCFGAAHLYGHSHGRLPELDSLLSFDVGVDVWGYVPIPWDAIQKKIDIKRDLIRSRNGFSADNGGITQRGLYSNDPEHRMIATRKKNLEILKSIGIDIPVESMSLSKDCLKALDECEKADKVLTCVVAVAGSTNSLGRMYSRELLIKLADNKQFFWDEKAGQLSVRARSAVFGDRHAVAAMFKQRIATTANS